jgi:hypothetical protein
MATALFATLAIFLILLAIRFGVCYVMGLLGMWIHAQVSPETVFSSVWVYAAIWFVLSLLISRPSVTVRKSD